MVKKLVAFILPVLILGIGGLQAGAYYVQVQDNSYDDNENVDVFKPQSGVKIKPSPLAQMMENATKNATQKNNQVQQKQTNTQTQKKQSSWF